MTAKYFAGGPLPGADTQWYVTASETTYTPPNRDDYVFGDVGPWWGCAATYDDEGGDRGYGGYKPPKTWSLASARPTRPASTTLHLDFLSVNPATPMSVTAHGVGHRRQPPDVVGVVGADRASRRRSTSALKTKRPFVEKGQPFDIDVIGVDLDGKARARRARSRSRPCASTGSTRRAVHDEGGRSADLRGDRGEGRRAMSLHDHRQGGTYQVVATIVDAKGRPNQTTLTFWVAGRRSAAGARGPAGGRDS